MKTIVSLVGFQIFTLILYYIGPIEYGFGEQSPWVVVLVLLYLFGLFFGYIWGRQYYFKGKSGPANYQNFIKTASLIVIAWSLVEIPGKLSLFTSGESIGAIYSSYQESRDETVSIFSYIRMLFGFYVFGLLPVLIVYWKKVSPIIRWVGVAAVMMNLLGDFLIGINKKIFDTIIISSIWFLYFLQGRFATIFTPKKIIGAFAIVIFFASAAYYFQAGQITRHGSFAKSGVSTELAAYSKYSANDGVLLSFYSSITGYLTQGYRAFDLSLGESFDFTWGVGNSTFLSRQVDRIFDVDISDRTYPAKIEAVGWNRYNYWSSFYVWWASDLTFVGVVFAMILIGFFIGSLENTVSRSADVSAIILYSYLILLVFYLSANNQIFQSGESFFGFWLLMLPLLIKRRRARCA